MSSLNLGNPTIGYAYKYPLKGSAFNKVFRNIISPGIYSGGILSYVANNISVTSYDALFNTGTNQLIAVHTESTIDLSSATPTGFGLGSITTLTPYIAMSFIWADSTTVYPDYIFSDSSILSDSNYLIIGRATFLGSVVSGFDYSDSTYPPTYNTSNKTFQVKKDLTVTGVINSSGTITSTVEDGTPPLTLASTTKVTNLNSDMVDSYHTSVTAVASTIPVYNGSAKLVGDLTGNATTATTALFSVNYDYIVDSNAKLLAWQGMTSGCTKVLLKSGTWTLGSGGINLTTTGTKIIVGEPGNNLVFSAAKGLSYETTPATSDFWIHGVSSTISSGDGAGFTNCTNLTNCAGSGSGTGSGSGFTTCTNLTNCIGTGTGTTNGSGYGFYSCGNLTNCVGAGTGSGSGTGTGFSTCTNIVNCIGTGVGTSSSAGFSGCTQLTNCTGSGTGSGSGSRHGFFGCTNVVNCVGAGVNAVAGHGFASCTNLTNCNGSGSGSSEGFGFYSCFKCTNNKAITYTTAKYYSSYASSNTSASCADTAGGGWNS